jgi:adenylate cyclase
MSRLLKAVLLGFFIGLFGVVISFFHLAHDLEENVGLGLLFKLRGARTAPSEVVVVSIDRESSENLNLSSNPDRWPRSLHARLIENLTREGVRVVVFDVYFTEPHSISEDDSLAEALRKAPSVVLAEPLRAKEISLSDNGGAYAGEHRIVQIVKPIAALSKSATATAPFVLPRIPVKVNQYWTFQTDAGESPTFPVVGLQLYALSAYQEFVRLLVKISPNEAGKLPADPNQGMKARGAVNFMRDIRAIFENDPSIAGKMIEHLERSGLASTDASKYRLLKAIVKMYGGANRRYLNYYGPARTVTTVPYYRALRLAEDSANGKQIDLNGKAVFVGLSEILLTERQDSFYTVFSRPNGVFISGVEIAATAFANLLEDGAVKPISSNRYLLTILIWGVLIGAVARMAATPVAAFAVAALSVLYLLAASHQFALDGTWYPIFVPLFLQSPVGFFGAFLWSFCETNKERRNIGRALGYYVPTEVAQQLAKNIVDMKKGGRTVYGTCLFTDAAGYTDVSEKMGPRELSDLMNRYFEVTFGPVKKNGGLVVDVKGDSIVAVWSAARRDAALQRQACHAALELAGAVGQFNRSFGATKLPTRIGVHAGEIFLGNIGAGDHFEYGVTGDTVNTASRLESLNKYLGTEILVSQDVVQGLDGFLTREAGSFRLKGKTQPLTVYELVACLEKAAEEQKQACAIFSEALRAFKAQSWDEAGEKFRRSAGPSGEDRLALFYLRLCEQFKRHPPEAAWEGVISMEEK